MTLESEFKEHWDTFHENMRKAHTLLHLYPNKQSREALASYESAVPDMNECFIKLLKIKDKRILRIFRQWRSTDKTREIAEEIAEKEVGGHLAADLTYTFWKYADVVRVLRKVQKYMEQRILLEQAIVASCTAFECFLKSMIPWVLKNHNESAKRYLGTVALPTKELGKFDFDPTGNVDKVFLHGYRNRLFPVFPDVVEFYKQVLGVDLFWSKREKQYVKKIFEVRHCIVHNAGKPDARWRRRTKGAKFTLDLYHTRKYVLKIHTKLHDTGALIFKLLGLDLEKAPFTAEEITAGPIRWEFV